MNTNSRFVVATHILTAMATKKSVSGKDVALKSDFLAESVDTNPVFIRRVIGSLRSAGLVLSQAGPNGGAYLAKAPESITLLEIYEAVDDGDLFHLHYGSPNKICPIGANIQDTLCEVFDQAKRALKEILAQKTLAHISEDIIERSGISKMMASGMSMEEIEQDIMERYEACKRSEKEAQRALKG